MKKAIILLLICNFCSLNAQNELVVPPGTLQLNDSLFIDKSPVTNLMFIEYLTVKKVLKNKGYTSFKEFTKETNENGFPIEMRIIIYPSPLLIEFYSNNKYLKSKGYGREYKFSYHPVLNVSKKLATDFCKWRSEMVSHLWLNDEKYSSIKNQSDKISYRLAATNELIRANTYFSNLKRAIEFKEKLLKIKQDKVTTEFTVFPVNELTTSEQLFNDKPNFEFTGFRCVCEMKK